MLFKKTKTVPSFVDEHLQSQISAGFHADEILGKEGLEKAVDGFLKTKGPSVFGQAFYEATRKLGKTAEDITLLELFQETKNTALLDSVVSGIDNGKLAWEFMRALGYGGQGYLPNCETQEIIDGRLQAAKKDLVALKKTLGG